MQPVSARAGERRPVSSERAPAEGVGGRDEPKSGSGLGLFLGQIPNERQLAHLSLIGLDQQDDPENQVPPKLSSGKMISVAKPNPGIKPMMVSPTQMAIMATLKKIIWNEWNRTKRLLL